MQVPPSFSSIGGESPRICILSIRRKDLPHKYVLVEEESDKNSIHIYFRNLTLLKDLSLQDGMDQVHRQFGAMIFNGEVHLIQYAIPNNDVPLDLRGVHLSTYMMHRIVRWAKKNFAQSTPVQKIGVSDTLFSKEEVDAENTKRAMRLYKKIGYKLRKIKGKKLWNFKPLSVSENTKRAMRLYKKIGYKFNKIKGKKLWESEPLRVFELKENRSWEGNITEEEPTKFIRDLLEDVQLWRDEAKNKGSSSTISDLRVAYYNKHNNGMVTYTRGWFALLLRKIKSLLSS